MKTLLKTSQWHAVLEPTATEHLVIVCTGVVNCWLKHCGESSLQLFSKISDCVCALCKVLISFLQPYITWDTHNYVYASLLKVGLKLLSKTKIWAFALCHNCCLFRWVLLFIRFLQLCTYVIAICTVNGFIRPVYKV